MVSVVVTLNTMLNRSKFLALLRASSVANEKNQRSSALNRRNLRQKNRTKIALGAI
jgi:hypothetical protein